MEDKYLTEAQRLMAGIALYQTELSNLAQVRPPITLNEVCRDRCNFTDRTVEAQVQAFMNRYDAVYVPDLAKLEDPESWELVAGGGGAERYAVKRIEGREPTEAAEFWVYDTEDSITVGHSYDEDEEPDCCDEVDRRNAEHTLENLNGFPFAQSYGYEIESFEIEQFAAAGFLVYRYDGDRLIAGIDGGGYSFLGAHWAPLYWAKALAGEWVVDTDTGPRRVA